MPIAAVLARRCRSAVRLGPSATILLPLAWAALGAASIALRLVPFRRLAPILGRDCGVSAVVPVSSSAAQRRAVTIARSVAVAARYAPFRSDCLPRALTAALLCRLGRVPHAAYLGANIADADRFDVMKAHAWVQSGPVAITGGRGNFNCFGVVACFVPSGVRD